MKIKEQLTFDDNPLMNRYKDTLPLIKNGDFKKAYHYYEEIAESNSDMPQIFSTMKCLRFWIPRLEKVQQITPGKKSSQYLSDEWQQFESFLSKKAVGHVENLHLIKEAVYQLIVDNYVHEFKTTEMLNADLLISLAEALIVSHDYQKAKDTLIYARKFRKNDPMILALLAECYYYLDNKKQAILFYKKAFFYDAEQIDITKLSSPIITDLIRIAEENGFINKERNLWLPIFATINKVFSEKEKLTEKEYNNLIKKIYDLEIKYNMANKSKGTLEPLLLNYYIIAMDHFLLINDEHSTESINSLLSKIKNLNGTVFEKLRKIYE